MRIKSFNRLFCILLSVTAVVLCLHGCTFTKNDQNYVTARYHGLISKSEDAFCWPLNVRWGNTDTDLYIEKDGKIKSKWDYNLNADPYYNSPLIYGNYLYYIGGIYGYGKKDVYIARINYTKKNPEIEKITENYNDIDSYAVLNNALYFSANKIVEDTSLEENLYIKRLSDDKEEVLIQDGPSEFCTNGEKIIAQNKIYDIETKTVESLHDNEHLRTLGVFENNYYCYYTGHSSEGHRDDYYTVLQIDLNNYSAVKLCEIPFGMTGPRLCDDKILFADQTNGCSTVGFYYYDIPTGKIVTVIDSDNSTQRYIDNNYEPIPMDYIIYDNMYYFHYGNKVITRVNMDTKQEEVFLQLPDGFTQDGPKYSYEWLSPKEYSIKEIYSR